MARCARCNKFMLRSQPSGYCKDCEAAVKEEARQKAEEERRHKEEEERRCKEEADRQRKAEEERHRKEEEERQRKAEEERRRKEEEKKRAEEEKKKVMSQKDAQREYDEGCKYFGSQDPSTKAKSAAYFLRAAEAGLAIAQTQIGNMYIQGDGVPRDIKKGIEWTEKAVAQGYPMAEANLAGNYFHGVGVPQDKKKAIELYKKAASKNDEYAQFMLGKIYSTGDGFPQDDKQARKYYLDAVTNGSVDALGEILGDDRMNYCGRKQCLATVKEEFNAFLSLMKKMIPVKDIGIKQEFFNTVMAAKRSENYVKASRSYMIITLQAGCLSSNVASGWLKVLAATGAVMDAIAVGEYALGYPNTERIIDQAWGMLENNTRLLKSYVANKSWQLLADRCTELAGGYSSVVKIEDLDVWL